MALNLDNYLSTYTNAVTLRSRRAQLLASNLANGDTPNYKARDFDFATALKQMTGEQSAAFSECRFGLLKEGSFLCLLGANFGDPVDLGL